MSELILNIKLDTLKNWERAVEYFGGDGQSDYANDNENREFLTIEFETDEYEVDALEEALTEELGKGGFESYSFESE